MLCRMSACALVCALVFVAPSWGQVPPVDQLRKQVEALQRQIDALEADEGAGKSATRERVTELGGGRHARGEPELVLRIYDLSDLFVQAPPYPAVRNSELGQPLATVFPPTGDTSGSPQGGGGFGGGGGFFSVPTPGTLDPRGDGALRQFAGTQQANGAQSGGRTSMDQLVEVITGTIAPESWSEVGGPGSIGRLGTSLVISADRTSHQQIDDLIDQLRSRWRTLRTVSVRAWWLWLNDDQVAALVQPVEPRGAPGMARANAQPGGPVHGLVDQDAWQALLAELAAGDAASAGYRAAVTCYNGQMVHTVTSEESLTVSDIEALLTSDDDGERVVRHVAYQPDVRILHEGAALQVLPTVTAGGDYVILDLHSQVCRIRERGLAAAGIGGAALAGAEQAAGDVPPQRVIAAIDRPRVATQRVSTTLRAPLDSVLLAGGMTFDGPAGPSTLYLFVEAGMQELRDDLPTGGQDLEDQPNDAQQLDGDKENDRQPREETTNSP